MKTEDADCESGPFFGEEANPLENGVEEMEKDVKVDASSTDWLSEFEQKYWSEVLVEKEKQKQQDTFVETSQRQPDSLSVADYGWPEDLDQTQWDPSEMFDVSELLGDSSGDVFTGLDQVSYPLDNVAGELSQNEKQRTQGLDSGYGLPALELEALDGNEFFDLSFSDLHK